MDGERVTEEKGLADSFFESRNCPDKHCSAIGCPARWIDCDEINTKYLILAGIEYLP